MDVLYLVNKLFLNNDKEYSLNGNISCVVIQHVYKKLCEEFKKETISEGVTVAWASYESNGSLGAMCVMWDRWKHKPTIEEICANQVTVEVSGETIVCQKQYNLFDEINKHYPVYERIGEQSDRLVLRPKKKWRAFTATEAHSIFPTNPGIKNKKTGTTAKIIGFTFDRNAAIAAGKTINYPLSYQRLVNNYVFADTGEPCGHES